MFHAYGILYLVDSGLKLSRNDWTQCRLAMIRGSIHKC